MPQRIEQKGAKMELGYWAIRGLAQPIRLLLVYVGTPFSDVRYGVNQDGTQCVNDWEVKKVELKMPFPNLPYLIDSTGEAEVRVSQSNSVMRYLGRRFDLYGQTLAEYTAIDVLQDDAYDYRNKIVDTVYTPNPEYEKVYAKFASDAVSRHVGGFERYLGERAAPTHFVGNNISIIDFILYELVWQTSVMVPGSVSATNHPNLFAFMTTFEKLPQIAAYLSHSDYIERPINSDSASFK
jgi:glutathione S-transferase